MRIKAKSPHLPIKLTLILGLFLLGGVVNGQVMRRMGTKMILPGNRVIALDSQYRVPKDAIQLINRQGQTKQIPFVFDPRSGILQLDSLPTDTLFVMYRSLPDFFYQPFLKRPISLLESVMPGDPFAYDPLRDGIRTAESGGLKTEGNISRGISAGNTQDLVVNSNLNMRLGGKIADDVRITGVISDDNNPVQPEGNTQQLQDFDKVYIMLSKDSSNLIAGDFEMKTPGGYFMNYYKKSRGLHADFSRPLRQRKVYFNTDAAISRGRFARNTLQGTEGNQGPYRLSGVNGETFIIVISGTEVVYLDGKRLQRGESGDYVINYNSGEITFMPSRMITGFSRIVVEFQYSDRNYQRTVLKSGLGIVGKKANFEINYFNEQDNKNQNFQQSLDGFDSARMLSARQILALAGDSVEQAFIPNLKTTRSFDYTKLLYRRIDTLGFNPVYVYTQNPESDTLFYEVVFSLVGQGRGNYRQKSSAANGRVYEWVQPVNGIPQGNYEPVELLIAPKRYQMITAGMRYRHGNTESFAEGVYTRNDVNTFSDKDKQNDQGLGFSAGIKNTLQPVWRNKKFTVVNQIQSELVNSDFRYLERYRPVEFERTWNKQLSIPQNPQNLKLPEIIAGYGFSVMQSDRFQLQYKGGIYHRSSKLTGNNHSLNAMLRHKSTELNTAFEKMSNTIQPDLNILKNDYYSYEAGLQQHFKYGRSGVVYHQEQSRFNQGHDSLIQGSYSFNTTRLFLQGSDSGRFTYGLAAERRNDQLPFKGQLNAVTRADQLEWNTGYTGKKGAAVQMYGTYRNLHFEDTTLFKGQAERHTLGRLEANLPLLKKALRWTTFYQTGTGQEQKREFTYLQVADGNGIYIWNDYDSNKIQSLNEFELASDYDRKRANFIKTSLPVQGFIKSRNLQFNQTLSLSAPSAWHSAKGWKNALSRFSLLLVYRTERKTISSRAGAYLNPFWDNLQDADLLSGSTNQRGTFYFNRNHPVWSADLTRVKNQSRTLLVNGFDTRESDENIFNIRLNLSRTWGTQIQALNGKKGSFSQFLANRNFTYRYNAVEPQLLFTAPGGKFGWSLIGKYYLAKAGSTKSENLEFGMDVRISKASKGSFSGNVMLVKIDFNGDPASPIGYELMRGLLPGQNYTWNLMYQQRLSANIQMDVSYDGRKSQNSPFIHIGRVMARYLF